jgi:tRNA1(Val) A37 N6-methylase TrmN6
MNAGDDPVSPRDTHRQLRQARARAAWEPPGPRPPGDLGQADLHPGLGETLDAFAGHWRIFQLRRGHRYSTDDLLVAWYAVDRVQQAGLAPRRALDLGTGIGSVALYLLWALPGLAVVGVEAQAGSLGLARRSAGYNGVRQRAAWVHGDLRRDLACWGQFDLVTASPPYWRPADGNLSTAPQRGLCRFECRGGVEAYCRAAAARLGEPALFCTVFDGRQLPRLRQAGEGAGLELVHLRPVLSRPQSVPLLVLASFRRRRGTGSKTVAVEAPPLLLRDAAGVRPDEFRQLRARMGMPPGPR